MRPFVFLPVLALLAGCSSDPPPNTSAADEYRMGEDLYQKSEFRGAEGAFSRAIKLDPEMAAAWFMRGRSREAQDDMDGALEDFSQAVTLNHKDAVSWFRAGRILLLDGEFHRAAVGLDMSLEVKSTPEALRARGLCASGLGEFAKAAPWLRESIGRARPGSDREFTICELFAAQSRVDLPAAREEMARFLKQNAPTPETEWPRTIASCLAGALPPAALLSKAQAFARDPRARTCEAAYYAGIAHLLAGDRAAAEDAFETCLDNVAPGFVEPPLALAELKRLIR
jgi:tetratricopeptide (TPR) repeat protein